MKKQMFTAILLLIAFVSSANTEKPTAQKDNVVIEATMSDISTDKVEVVLNTATTVSASFMLPQYYYETVALPGGGYTFREYQVVWGSSVMLYPTGNCAFTSNGDMVHECTSYENQGWE